ncbi:hypothetical protein L484_018156 [Morus notabilis]|uniref:Uncharacterized protein n=1 Tax=Morus notabilis TaxID=981085 RepID=W9RK55_9ROSA|nr:hypothetical protein L484_018156 [Morus notabilis]
MATIICSDRVWSNFPVTGSDSGLRSRVAVIATTEPDPSPASQTRSVAICFGRRFTVALDFGVVSDLVASWRRRGHGRRLFADRWCDLYFF